MERGNCKTTVPQEIDDFAASSEGQLAGSSRADENMPKRAGEEARREVAAKGRFYGAHEFCNGLEPLIVSIGGGKGGVGKSMVSSNLAVQYAKAGFKVILLDLDIGASNLHTIFGIRNPPKGLGDYFITPRSQVLDYIILETAVRDDKVMQDFELESFANRGRHSLMVKAPPIRNDYGSKDCVNLSSPTAVSRIIPTSIPNLKLAPGSGFVPEMTNLKTAQKTKLIHQIKSLDANIVLLDLGAGTSHAVIDFFSMTHYGIIVTSPEPTSIVNAYEFLKNVIYRILFRIFRSQPEILELLKISAIPNNSLHISTIAELIEAISKCNPWAAQNVSEICQDLNITLIFNQARKISEAELAPKLHEISRRFLGIDLNFGGMIFYNEEVSASIFKMMPISIVYPDSVTSKTLKDVATRILRRIMNKLEDNQKIDPFEKQFQKTLFNTKKDYECNILTQNRLQRAREYNEPR